MRLLILILALIQLAIGISICSKRDSSVGRLLSTFTEPMCSGWCRVRGCGSGRCRLAYKSYGDRGDRHECVCDRCRNPYNLYSDY
ncbi:hypothetical protein Y032_0446g1598 [Ancylostoma ceylanicum]|uniref:Uncharacterized protein n=1 Tax=Ancylostoma ceylanicum TaxID=53326 RepID=A0A016WYH3_9BILA|nr:hypothetical protein Y032_0446g1598 [Ancylostoma ceylanicum]